MKKDQKKLMAVFSALLAVLIVSAAVVPAAVESDDTDENAPALGIEPITTLIVITFIMGAVTGFFGHMAYEKLTTQGADDTDKYVRGQEAKVVSASIMSGLAYYDNALANYSQIWPLTNEHHIRQAEITASFNWSKDASYDPGMILENSAFYTNASYMLRNASAQVNSHFDNLNERLQLWNQTDVYKNKMNMEIKYGLDSIQSASSIGVAVGTAVDATAQKNKVYLTGGDLWVFGGSATLTGGGKTIFLSQGCNDLDSISGFSEGIYTLQADRSYSGGLLPVVDVNAAPVMTSLVLKAGNDTKLAKLTSQGIVVDDVVRENISIAIHPDGAESETADITSLIADYDELLKSIRQSIVKASNAAATVWNIFDKAGESNVYLTTLMMPNQYENINITQAQQEVLTVLSMEQIVDYYNAHGGDIKSGEYTFSKDSLTLYVRGDLCTADGKKLYENVIFTPFVYGQDMALSVGKNTLNQPGIMAVWSLDGTPLSAWNPGTSMNDAKQVMMSQGYMLDIYEMYYDSAPATSVNLEITKLKLIDPSPFPDPDPIDPVPSDGLTLEQIIKIICIVVGVLMILGGLLARFNWTLIIVGVIVIAGGLLLAGPIVTIAGFL